MKKILVPTDFSKEAYNALTVAFDWALKSGEASIDLLHVVDNLGHDPKSTSFFSGKMTIDEEALQAPMERLREKVNTLAQREGFELVTVNPIVQTGSFSKVISQYIEEQSPDLVVMGSRGHTEWERLWLGSSTEKVISKGNTPLLVVHDDTQISAFKEMVLVTYGEQNLQPYLERLKEWQEMLSAKLHILWVNTPADFMSAQEVQEVLEQVVEEVGFENYVLHSYSDYTVVEGVMHFVERTGADMVAMLSHPYTALGQLFEPAPSHVLKEKAQVPVLLFPITPWSEMRKRSA